MAELVSAGPDAKYCARCLGLTPMGPGIEVHALEPATQSPSAADFQEREPAAVTHARGSGQGMTIARRAALRETQLESES
jgi:hypothetical protein